MSGIYNIYCDESCHLENDRCKAMVLGGVSCPIEQVLDTNNRLRQIKKRHDLPIHFETKWTKISPAKLDFYKDVVDYFFDNSFLNFRALVIQNKNQLDHNRFMQNHDQWYYKMYFVMLKYIFQPSCRYNIYIDIKDTRSQSKVKNLHDVLCHNIYDFDRKIIMKVQQIRSHEVEIMQITDLLIGALCHLHRGLKESSAKADLIQHIKYRSKLDLTRTTLPREEKFNILVWQPQGDHE